MRVETLVWGQSLHLRIGVYCLSDQGGRIRTPQTSLLIFFDSPQIAIPDLY